MKRVYGVLLLLGLVAFSGCSALINNGPMALVAAAVVAVDVNSRPANIPSPTPIVIVSTPVEAVLVQDLVIGTGTEAKPGMQITAHYTGMLTNGTVFDSSYKRNQPFSFTLGAGQVIKGWDQGVGGMRVGGKRRLTIPPQLAYGAQGVSGVIPPNAWLIFDIELLDAK